MQWKQKKIGIVRDQEFFTSFTEYISSTESNTNIYLEKA